jgi:signal recognition particle subunit SRP54
VLKSYAEMLKMMRKLRGKPGVLTGQKRRKLPKGLRR